MAQIYIFSQRQFDKVMSDMGGNDGNIAKISNTAIAHNTVSNRVEGTFKQSR